MRLRKNDKGMTLIELIISIAISAIILSMIIIIINSASHSFRRTNDEVNLQLEAQTTINQLSNLVMEAEFIEPSTSTPLPNKRFFIKGKPTNYALIYNSDEKRLFLIEANTLAETEGVTYSKESSLLAEYVDIFEITGTDTNKVTISISFVMGEDEYSVSRKIKLRNYNP